MSDPKWVDDVKTCEYCDWPVRGLGLCVTHLHRYHRGLDLAAPVLRTVEERFWAKVDKQDGPDGCWLWTGSKTNAPRWAYGQFRNNNRLLLAHRFSYELANGPIPEGLVLDHLCRVPACVRPSHLEPVTHAVNCQRGLKSALRPKREYCTQGHLLDEQNSFRSRASIICRTCRNAYKRAYYKRRKAAA